MEYKSIKELKLDELRLYKATVEIYGSPAELVEVAEMIRKKEQEKTT